MLNRMQVSMAVFSITNQEISEYYLEPKGQRKRFAKDTADLIMGLYDEKIKNGSAYKGLTIRHVAVLLTTEVMIDLERKYARDHEMHIIMTIGILKECLTYFGEMYREQILVSGCLAAYAKRKAEIEQVATPDIA